MSLRLLRAPARRLERTLRAWAPPPGGTRAFTRLLPLAVFAASAAAADFTAWSHRQPLSSEPAGLTRIALPDATLDRARADLADLRLIDRAGVEVPFAVIRPPASIPERRAPREFRASLEEGRTVLVLITDSDSTLLSVTLSTSAGAFVKAASVATLLADGRWEEVVSRVPIFRQGGEVQLTLTLPRVRTTSLRLTIDDSRSAPVAFSGAQLTVAGADAPTNAAVPVRIRERMEIDRETIVSVDLGAARLPLSSIRISTPEPVFRRMVRVLTRDWQDGGVIDRPVTLGEIARFAFADLPGLGGERLTIDLGGAQPPTRELVLRIDNGDSPPLPDIAVTVERRPVHLVTAGAAAELLVGHPGAPIPRYDLAGLVGGLSPDVLGRLPEVRLGTLSPNAGHRALAPLAAVLRDGAPLEDRPWTARRTVAIVEPGLQQLELDRDVLAQSRADLGDLRLSRNGAQVPYVLERSARENLLTLIPAAANDPDRPRVGRWTLTVPKDLPVTRVTLTSRQPLFQRFVQLIELAPDTRGSVRPRLLAAQAWIRTPDTVMRPFVLEFPVHRGETLLLEADNGDNAPLEIDTVTVAYPRVRLLFNANDRTPVVLHYGDRRLSPPRYDLSLVASELLSSATHPARFADAIEDAVPAPRGGLGGIRATWLFWGGLAVAVVALLAVIAKLLPASKHPRE
jgi:hypothetical protein